MHSGHTARPLGHPGGIWREMTPKQRDNYKENRDGGWDHSRSGPREKRAGWKCRKEQEPLVGPQKKKWEREDCTGMERSTEAEGRASAKEGVVGESPHCTRGSIFPALRTPLASRTSHPALNALHHLQSAEWAASLTGSVVLLGTAWPQLRELHHGHRKGSQLTRSGLRQLQNQNHKTMESRRHTQNSSTVPAYQSFLTWTASPWCLFYDSVWMYDMYHNKK